MRERGGGGVEEDSERTRPEIADRRRGRRGKGGRDPGGNEVEEGRQAAARKEGLLGKRRPARALHELLVHVT